MAGKRGNKEGLIRKRIDGRWEARISLPDGSKKSFYAQTRQEVERKASQARRDIESGLPLVDERQTLGQYLDAWLETVKYQIDPSSWQTYSLQIRKHIAPALGSHPLAKVSAQLVQRFYTKKLDDGLAPATVRLFHIILHSAMADALRLSLIQRNTLDMVRAPKPADREMMTFSQEQVRVFLASIENDRFYALFVLALSTGLRRGELLALHWQDVDLERSILHVRTGLQRVGGKYIHADPKSKHSKRRIVLSQKAVDALRLHRIRQDKERLELGAAWGDGRDYIFPNTLGRQMSPSYLSVNYFSPLLKRAGLPRIRFHDLRHTAATLLLSRGVNIKVVSEMLGHSDIAITLRVYAHVLPDMQQAAADVMDAVMGS